MEANGNIDVDKALRLAVCSDQRKDILLLMNEGMKSLRELREELKLSPPAIVHSFESSKRAISFAKTRREATC